MRKVGVVISQEEEDAVLSLWRYAGLLTGVNRELVVSSAYEGHRLSEILQMINGLPDNDSHELIGALFGVGREIFSSRYKTFENINWDQFFASLFRCIVGKSAAKNVGLESNKFDLLIPFLRAYIYSKSSLKQLQSNRDDYHFSNGRTEWEEIIAELDIINSVREDR